MINKLSCRVEKNKSVEMTDNAMNLESFLHLHGQAMHWGFSKGQIRQLIVTGFVYVNGKRSQNAKLSLKGNEVIDIYWDDKKMKPNKLQTKEDSGVVLKILYEDEAIVCLEKPSGMPTQPTIDKKRINLFDLAKEQLKQRSNPIHYLGLHHRLDRDTSGVVLMTAQKKYNELIASQFSKHTMVKQYVAVVHGVLKKEKGRLETFMDSLGPIGPKGLEKYGSVKSGGKKAITDYLVLDHSKEFSLIQVSITTGRTHQIRVHFSELGHPIVGDSLYGSPAQYFEKHHRFFLHAHSISFEHPITKNCVRVESPVPPQFRSFIK